MPGRTSRTVVHIIRAATYDGQGVETDLWESDLAPPRKQGGRNTHRTPKGTAPPPDPTVNHATGTLPRQLIGARICSSAGADLWTTGQRIWRASAENPRPLLQAALREQLRGRPLARLGAPFVVRASLPFGATLRGSPAGAGKGWLRPPSIPRTPALRRSSRAGGSPPVPLAGAS